MIQDQDQQKLKNQKFFIEIFDLSSFFPLSKFWMRVSELIQFWDNCCCYGLNFRDLFFVRKSWAFFKVNVKDEEVEIEDIIDFESVDSKCVVHEFFNVEISFKFWEGFGFQFFDDDYSQNLKSLLVFDGVVRVISKEEFSE